jgi:hypothetical protein
LREGRRVEQFVERSREDAIGNVPREVRLAVRQPQAFFSQNGSAKLGLLAERIAVRRIVCGMDGGCKVRLLELRGTRMKGGMKRI